MRRSESWFPGLAGALVLVALSVSVNALQGAPGSPTLNAYAAMVGRYRQGQIDAAIEEVTTRDRRWIEEALRLLERADWPAVDLEAAALLHTEAAWDGRAEGLSARHLSTAEWIVNRNISVPTEFRRRWYLLVTWHLQSELRFEDLARHVDAMVKRFPADGEVLLALGSLYEALGWSRESPIDLSRAEPVAEARVPGDPHPAISTSLAGGSSRSVSTRRCRVAISRRSTFDSAA
jgi:hypothetical protein